MTDSARRGPSGALAVPPLPTPLACSFCSVSFHADPSPQGPRSSESGEPSLGGLQARARPQGSPTQHPPRDSRRKASTLALRWVRCRVFCLPSKRHGSRALYLAGLQSKDSRETYLPLPSYAPRTSSCHLSRLLYWTFLGLRITPFELKKERKEKRKERKKESHGNSPE